MSDDLHTRPGPLPAAPTPEPVLREWRPYLRGQCYDFALALHAILPGSRLVAFGNAKYPDHVAVQLGSQLIDVRGPLPLEIMVLGMSGEQEALATGPIAVSVDDVALHVGMTAANLKLPAAVRKNLC